MNRRDFFRHAAVGAGSAALLGAGLNVRAEDGGKGKPQCPLATRTLGRTGIVVPVVSMGVMNADNPELLRQSYRLGVRHFDTAWVYQRGNNERMVGRVLGEIGAPRGEYTVATKVVLDENPDAPVHGAQAKDLFLQRFAESLSRLKMEYVDVLYYHSVQSKEQAEDPNIIDAIRQLKAEKKVRFAGISTHGYWPEILTAAADGGFYDVALLSYNYSMDGDPKLVGAMQHARGKGMGLVAMKTQCQQSWYRDMLPDNLKKFYEGKVMHSALLKWVARTGYFATAVPGYTTFQQMEEDIAVARNLDYTPAEKGFLEDRHVRLALAGNCHLCGRCSGSCIGNADIPNLMRTHMYAYSYGNAAKAKETLMSIGTGRGLTACAGCETCSAQCVRSVDIARRIGDLKILYA
jgi:hypothetical protein